MEITVRPDFRDLLPTLTADELQGLLESLDAEGGATESLVVWKGEGVLVDGHNRYAYCEQNGLAYTVREKEFADETEAKNWMLDNQLGRRNLSPFAKIEIEEIRVGIPMAEKAKGQQARKPAESVFQNSEKQTPINTTKAVADAAGVSTDTVAKARKITKQADPETIEKVRAGEISINEAHKRATGKGYKVPEVEVEHEEGDEQEEAPPIADARMHAISAIICIKRIKRGHPEWRESLIEVRDLIDNKLKA